LMALNRCRVFLRVLFLSDICSADGTTILHAFRKGERSADRISNLDWPFQPRPPRSDWVHWERSLASLEECGKLLKPLGTWVACSHQQWQCFYDSSTTIIYHTLGSTWRRYHQICVHQSNYNTRRSSVPWFSTNHFSDVTSKPADAIVASMDIDPLYNDHLFRVSVSPNAMPNHLPTVCPKGGSAHIVFKEGAQEPHSFYHHLLQWDMSLLAPQVAPIADAIRNGDLHVCADGAYMPDLQQGAQAWVFSTADQHILGKLLDLLLAYILIYDPPLKEHIIQRAKWNHSQFDRVDWVAHAAAFHQHSRLQCLSITKLAHGLYHTNSEAHKLYGSPATCPCCLKHNETLPHLFTYSRACRWIKISKSQWSSRKLTDEWTTAPPLRSKNINIIFSYQVYHCWL
jgi:hypothetical protein